MRSTRNQTIAVVTLLALALFLLATCERDIARSPAPPGRPAPEVAAAPARHTPRTRAAVDAARPERSTVATAPATATAPASAASGASKGEARIRVTVTCDGQPAPGADVWLVDPWPASTLPGHDNVVLIESAEFSVFPGVWYGHTVVTDGASLRKSCGEPGARTGQDGRATLTVAPGRQFEVRVAAPDERWNVPDRPRVATVAGETKDVVVTARRPGRIAGRCVDTAGRGAPRMWVQAVAAHAERPVSNVAETDSDGGFVLETDTEELACRVRAVEPRGWFRGAALLDPGAPLPALRADVTVENVVPGGNPIEIRLSAAPAVAFDVTADVPFADLQVEALRFDDDAGAWRSRGGPTFRREGAASVRGVAAVPRADIDRKVLVWSWTTSLTSADVGDAGRVSVRLPGKRKALVRGTGWRPDDRLRVTVHVGSPGAEIPVVWLEDGIGGRDEWKRDDAPPAEIEFRIIRDGVPAGKVASVPAAATDAPEVRIDL